MNEKYPYYNCHIIVTKTPEKYKEIFHKKIIFTSLTEEYMLKLMFLQKMKQKVNNFTSINIYLEDFKLDDFNFSSKLNNLISSKLNELMIHFKDIKYLNLKEIKQYNNFIHNYS